jgi:hypothetical protein
MMGRYHLRCKNNLLLFSMSLLRVGEKFRLHVEFTFLTFLFILFYKPIGAAPRWHLFWWGRGPLVKKGCYAQRATDFREERNPPQAYSIVNVLIDSKLCTIQYYNITILQYCTIL